MWAGSGSHAGRPSWRSQLGLEAPRYVLLLGQQLLGRNEKDPKGQRTGRWPMLGPYNHALRWTGLRILCHGLLTLRPRPDHFGPSGHEQGALGPLYPHSTYKPIGSLSTSPTKASQTEGAPSTFCDFGGLGPYWARTVPCPWAPANPNQT